MFVAKCLIIHVGAGFQINTTLTIKWSEGKKIALKIFIIHNVSIILLKHCVNM